MIINKSSLTLVIGQKEMAKSSFIMKTILDNCNIGNRIIFFTPSMSSEIVLSRLFSIKHTIPLQEVSQCGEMRKVMKIPELFIYDEKDIALNKIINQSSKILSKSYSKESIIIIDYIQLIRINTSKKNTISTIIQELKQFACKENISIIIVYKLDTSLHKKDKRPNVQDIKHWDFINKYIDYTISLYRDEIYKEKEEDIKRQMAKLNKESYENKFVNSCFEDVELVIKKRNGQTKNLLWTLDKRFLSLLEISKETMLNDMVDILGVKNAY